MITSYTLPNLGERLTSNYHTIDENYVKFTPIAGATDRKVTLPLVTESTVQYVLFSTKAKSTSMELDSLTQIRVNAVDS